MDDLCNDKLTSDKLQTIAEKTFLVMNYSGHKFLLNSNYYGTTTRSPPKIKLTFGL